MQAVWSSSSGVHIPFENVLFVQANFGPDPTTHSVSVHLTDGQTWFDLSQGGEEFMKQWYAWLHRDVEEIEIEPLPHPGSFWNHEAMRQAQDERAIDGKPFDPEASLRRQVRKMQGGFDVV